MTDEMNSDKTGDENSDLPKTEDGEESDLANESSVQFLGSDGEWHEIEVEPKNTGDPELDQLWSMSIDEMEAILEDESHPLHEKAKEVTAEAIKPIVDASNDVAKMLKSIALPKFSTPTLQTLDLKKLFPLDSTSWISKLALAPEIPKFTLSDKIVKPFASDSAISLPMQQQPEQHQIDFDSIQSPVASIAEIHKAADSRAHEMREEQIRILTEMLNETHASSESAKEALNVSKESLEATKRSVKEAKGSRIAAWTAAILGLASLLATIILGVLSL
jgi:hypothetical protein